VIADAQDAPLYVAYVIELKLNRPLAEFL